VPYILGWWQNRRRSVAARGRRCCLLRPPRVRPRGSARSPSCGS